MIRPPYPPFAQSDFNDVRLSAENISEQISDKASLISKRLMFDHDFLELHRFRLHPWCESCEFEAVVADSGVPVEEVPTPSQMQSYRTFLDKQGLLGCARHVREFMSEYPEESGPSERLALYLAERKPFAFEEPHVRILWEYGKALDLYDDYDIMDSLRSVMNRIRTYLFLYGKPPADNYDPETDASAVEPRYLNRTEIEDLPDPEWIIPGILTRYAYSILRGRDTSYKTFIALSWAASIATGRPWLGKPVQRLKVMYVVAEGAHGISKRARAWELAFNDGELIPDDALTFRDQAVNLYSAGADLDELLKRIEEGDYGLVIIDTLNKCSGVAEVNGSQSNAILASIERIKRATKDGSVIVIGHTGKTDEDIRGWSGFEDDADIVWHAKAKDGLVSLANAKMKDSAESQELILAPKVVAEANSIVLELAEGSALRNSQLSESQAQLLKTFTDAFAETGATKRELIDASGLKRSTFYHALNALKESGVVVTEGKGDKEIHRLSSNAVQSGEDYQSLTDSNVSNALQSSLQVSADCLSMSNNSKELDIGQTAAKARAS